LQCNSNNRLPNNSYDRAVIRTLKASSSTLQNSTFTNDIDIKGEFNINGDPGNNLLISNNSRFIS